MRHPTPSFYPDVHGVPAIYKPTSSPMKKIVLSLLLFAAAITCAFSQTDSGPDRRPFVAITGGSAVPLGNYSSIDIDNSAAGFAYSGYVLSLHWGIPFKKLRTTGISFQVDYFSNTFGSIAFLNAIATEPTLNYTLYSSGSYSGLNSMIGTLSSFPVKKTFIDVSAQVGVTSVSFPSILVKMDDGTGNEGYVGINSASGISVCYAAYVGWRLPLGHKFCATARIGFFSAKPNFAATQDTIVVDSNGNWETEKSDYTFSQPVTNLTFSGGIGYLFGK
jgi:hypothetical protein